MYSSFFILLKGWGSVKLTGKPMPIRRRTLLELAPLALAQRVSAQSSAATSPVAAGFPSQTPELAREMVSVSHGNIKRVRELLKAHPTLAKAAWDWGFGDWETSLGAASHVGNREIAELLIENGAAPTLFSATMLGQLEVVKVLIAATPGAQRILGPHSISLLAHAKAGGEASKAVYQYLDSLGDAGGPEPSPITEAEMATLAGLYSFGNAPNERIEIKVVRGQLEFTRTGTAARRLFHLGNLTFRPAGATAVRIRFDVKGTLTVADPDVILTAQRVPPAGAP